MRYFYALSIGCYAARDVMTQEECSARGGDIMMGTSGNVAIAPAIGKVTMREFPIAESRDDWIFLCEESQLSFASRDSCTPPG